MMPRKLMEKLQNPLEFVLSEDDFRAVQDYITDAIVALVVPGDEREKISKALDHLTRLREVLYATVYMRRAIDE